LVLLRAVPAQAAKGVSGSGTMSKINSYLDPDALTIGFAPFCNIQRATLLLGTGPLVAILKNPDQPCSLSLPQGPPARHPGRKYSIDNPKSAHIWLGMHVVFLETTTCYCQVYGQGVRRLAEHAIPNGSKRHKRNEGGNQRDINLSYSMVGGRVV
jgi:hypothetical protein